MAARRKGKAAKARKSTGTKRGASRKKAARKKKTTARRKAGRKKAAPRKKAGRKKVARKKKAARKKVARKKKAARKKAAKRTTGRKAPPKRAARKAEGSAIEAIARRIVKFTREGNANLAELYTENATSVEPGGGEPLVGLAALQGKMDMWESMQTGAVWNPRNVWTRGNTIAIEWDCDVTLANGRTVKLDEIAVHEIRGGKIAAERYYYDPSIFQAAAAEASPDPTESRAPSPPPEPVVERASGAIEPRPVEPDPDRTGDPPIDPLDI